MNPVELAALLARIEPLSGLSPDECRVSRLPGLTNDNYRLRADGHDWVLRVPRPATNAWIDRGSEAANQDHAAGLGIAPAPAWRESSGLSLTPVLHPGSAVRAEELRDPVRLERILEPFRQLHRSGPDFAGRVELGPLIERYYALMPRARQQACRERLQAARLLWAQVEDRDLPPVPSHNDPVLDNLLHADGQIWLIDWEFSALASPYWDLATLCNAGGLGFDDSLALLRCYCAGGTRMEESLLFDYRNLLQLLGDCWMTALVER